MSGCFSRRTSATGCLVLVHWSSGRRHPSPPSLPVAQRTACRSLLDNTVSWYLRANTSSSSSLPLAALTSLVAPYALESPTRPAWITLLQSSIRLVIHSRISRALQTPNVFVRTTWEKTRGILEFKLRSITPCHSMATMAVKRSPTAPVGVAYQIANWVASRRQRRCHIAASVTPPWGKSP